MKYIIIIVILIVIIYLAYNQGLFSSNKKAGDNGNAGTSNGNVINTNAKPRLIAVYYPSKDGNKWGYVDMSVDSANKYANHNGWYTHDYSNSTILSDEKRYLYAFNFCQNKNTCNESAVKNRIKEF